MGYSLPGHGESTREWQAWDQTLCFWGDVSLLQVFQSLAGFPGGASGEEPACQCGRGKRCGFSPWVRKIPWKRKWQPTPVFLPGESPAGQEATVRTEHGTTDWFQIGKGVCQGCILSPCLFNLYAEYIMRNAGLEHKLESRLPGQISITSDMQMTPPLWQKMKRNSKAS